jgi:outer membrane protein OmpA-like peptidoglycan-associated protein
VNHITNKTTIVSALALATITLGGCATEDYVDKAVAGLQTQVTAQGAQLSVDAAHLAKLDGDTQAAMTQADAAGKLAAGKFNYDQTAAETALFATGSAKLSDAEQAKLTELATTLKTNNKSVYIEIQGYTDATGSARTNEALVQARAEVVYNYLANQGVTLGRMTTISHGANNAVAPNTDSAGRAQNRRVVIGIVQ